MTMSGLATRGQEAQIRVTVQDEYAGQFGLFGQLPLINVNDWTLSPRTDLVEKDYLGEKTTSLDVMHHGYDFNFTVDETSSVVIDLLDLIQWKEENNLPPPRFTVAATVKYRDGVTRKTEQLIDCRLKVAERGFGGRTEYISSSIEGKARSRKTLPL
jgi:hypothetical protein